MPKRHGGHRTSPPKAWGESGTSDPQSRENENGAGKWYSGPEGETWEDDYYDWMKAQNLPMMYDYRDADDPEEEESYYGSHDPEKKGNRIAAVDPYYDEEECDCCECQGWC